MIRRLPFGRALLVLRSARPIVLQLTPWTQRRDCDAIKQGRAEVEQTIRAQAARQWGVSA
jgi:type IV secretion system protein VirD4